MSQLEQGKRAPRSQCPIFCGCFLGKVHQATQFLRLTVAVTRQLMFKAYESPLSTCSRVIASHSRKMKTDRNLFSSESDMDLLTQNGVFLSLPSRCLKLCRFVDDWAPRSGYQNSKPRNWRDNICRYPGCSNATGILSGCRRAGNGQCWKR